MPASTPTNLPADTGPGQGLTSGEARLRLAVAGRNALPDKAPAGLADRFAKQFGSPLIYILLLALAVDLFAWWREGHSGWPVESTVIAAILVLNASLGVWQERKAETALARLRQMAAPQAWAFRDRQWKQVEASDIAPGDVVRIEAGDRVPADGTLLGTGVTVDESILTGESMPVEKEADGEMLSGTLVVRGRSMIEVSRTGPRSALGRIAGLLGEMEEEPTPLERRLEVFGNRVARWVLVLCAALFAEGLLTQGVARWSEVLLFAVALAVAAVPEGLPAVMTLTLALGVERMAARKAVVRRLSAVEALGSVTVILTDKTGTLTENRMQVRSVDSPEETQLLTAIVLANDADQLAGDPIDLALADFARSRGIDQESARRAFPRVAERPFDSVAKFQRVTTRLATGETVSYLKGAPEVLLERAKLPAALRQTWAARAQSSARQGMRVLAAARGAGENETELEFLGLIHLWDPPRPEVASALKLARMAGIRVVMVTGDHPDTAAAIAAATGLDTPGILTGEDLDNLTADPPDAGIFARVRPEHKLQLVEALQRRGEVVAMTGDGVNDAPALKRADVGIAMGTRGSDVAREAADIVLIDDNLSTIVAAIEEGRSIYENTQKFIRFMFSTNLAEVIVVSAGVALSSILGLTDASGVLLLPLTAVQILWINLVTDGLPALALALDRNPGVMSDAPRPAHSPLLDAPSLRFVVGSGIGKGLIALAILGASWFGWCSDAAARTAMFQFLAIGQLFFVYPSRSNKVMPLPNRWLHGAVALGVAVQVLAGVLPGPAALLGLTPLTAELWVVVFCAALLSCGIGLILRRRGPQLVSQ